MRLASNGLSMVKFAICYVCAKTPYALPNHLSADQAVFVLVVSTEHGCIAILRREYALSQFYNRLIWEMRHE